MEPMIFATESTAKAWLNDTGHKGIIWNGVRGFFIIQLQPFGVFAFVSDTLMVLLEDW